MSHGDQFDQQHDESGFWRDEPTSRLERITERLPQIRGRFQRSAKEWEFGWDDEQVAAPTPAPRVAPPARPTVAPTASRPTVAPTRTAPRDRASEITRELRRSASSTRPQARPTAAAPIAPSAPSGFVDPLLRARAAAPSAPVNAPAVTADVDMFDDEAEVLVAAAPRTGGVGLAGLLQQVDPAVKRVAALVAAVVLAVPVMGSLGSGGGAASVAPENSTLATGTPLAAADATPTTLMEIGATVPPAPQQGGESAGAESGSDNTSAPASTAAPATVAATPATESATPGRLESTQVTCAKEYEVVAGDYWILIAKKASVTVEEVLAANKATVATAIFPGTTICLPANASTPTTAPPTTAAPAPPTTAKPPTATAPPPTTAKPVPPTTVVPVKTSYTRAEVEAIIRYTWPDHLEDEAVRIATRESNLIPTAKNFCCYGLFQIYFDVHKGWLAQLGVTSAQQLLDPHINAYVAVALYNRAGGWGPWKL